MNPRHKPIAIAVGVLVAVWAFAMAGYVIAKNAKVTGEKVRAYLAKTDLSSSTRRTEPRHSSSLPTT